MCLLPTYHSGERARFEGAGSCVWMRRVPHRCGRARVCAGGFPGCESRKPPREQSGWQHYRPSCVGHPLAPTPMGPRHQAQRPTDCIVNSSRANPVWPGAREGLGHSRNQFNFSHQVMLPKDLVNLG